MCFATCQADNRAWFEAAYHNDVELLREFKCFNVIDGSSTDLGVSPPRIASFRAINYAILQDAADAVIFLMKHEEWVLQGTPTIPVYIDAVFANQQQPSLAERRGGKLPMYFTFARQSSIIHLATACGARNVLAVLSESQHFKQHLVNASGCTPLMYAAVLGRKEMIEMLISCVAMSDKDGNTALSYACYYGRPDFLEMLMREATAGAFGLKKIVRAHNYQRRTPSDLCDEAIDDKRFQTSHESKERCKRLLGEIQQQK